VPAKSLTYITKIFSACEADLTPVGPEKIRALLPKIDSTVFSADLFEQMGVFVVRGAIPQASITFWQGEWEKFYTSTLASGRNVGRFNPVQVNENLPDSLSSIPTSPYLLDIAEQAFGPDIALFGHRFVIKDKHSRSAVFLHHDFCYHLGWPTKASAFVPLSTVTSENGAMVFYPGTHHFGYLGDAGEINPDVAGVDWPTITPSLNPGDMVLMNSSTWHRSLPHTGGPDRIMADIIYQPANDPSGIALLRGQWRTEIFLNKVAKHQMFTRSRSTLLKDKDDRIRALEQAVPTDNAP